MPSFEYFCLILKVFCCIVELCVTRLGLHAQYVLAVHRCGFRVKFRIEYRSKYLKHDQIVAVNDAVTNAPNLSGIASKFLASTVSARVPCWVEMRYADTVIQTVPFAVKPRGVWHRLPCSK